MYLDGQNMFDSNRALSGMAFGATYPSTNGIDLNSQTTDQLGNTGSIVKDPHRGLIGELFAQITATATSGGAPTIVLNVIQSAASDLSSPTILASTSAIALATLVAGYRFRIELPQGVTQRYLGVSYTIATANYTGGTISTGFVMHEQSAPNSFA